MPSRLALREALYLRALELVMNRNATCVNALTIAARHLDVPPEVLADAHAEVGSLIETNLLRREGQPDIREYPMLLAKAIKQTQAAMGTQRTSPAQRSPRSPGVGAYLASALKVAAALPETPLRALLLQDLRNAQTALEGNLPSCAPASSTTPTN